MLVLMRVLMFCLEISSNVKGRFEKFVHPKGRGLKAESHEAACGVCCDRTLMPSVDCHFAVTQRPKRNKRGLWAFGEERSGAAAFGAKLAAPVLRGEPAGDPLVRWPC